MRLKTVALSQTPALFEGIPFLRCVRNAGNEEQTRQMLVETP